MHLLRISLSALVALGIVTPVAADQYPIKPITIVTGYAVGAASDMLARTLAEGLQAEWGQPVVVDNRPGSSGNIAAAYVARSQPDGYTLMVAADPALTTNSFLFKSLPFDPLTSFAPVLNIAANLMVLAMHPEVPVSTVAEFISYAKERPDKVSFGSSGSGTPHHLAGELLMQMADIRLVHIPYKEEARLSMTCLAAIFLGCS
jgi:tripartite-type tricarboxylate transporter receptor subunit TctC